ncbi:unnamed protein product [Angiostrongylus costaricensis]|uniref:Uncharacterized protein n=1 Tax=Angiostrongylus costaricensis TaxID=334426 RepID=A0A0R3PET2_ANGCS|nr:unnamed protein product [Angiostrongylus costaricensis]
MLNAFDTNEYGPMGQLKTTYAAGRSSSTAAASTICPSTTKRTTPMMPVGERFDEIHEKRDSSLQDFF